MTTSIVTQVSTPTASPYAITPVPGADWLFELTWQGRPIDTFYSYGDAEDASLTHAALWEADTACGDMLVLTPTEQWEAEGGVIASQSIAMLDTCLGSLPELQAACLMVELERDMVWVEPVDCAFCKRTHLKRVGR